MAKRFGKHRAPGMVRWFFWNDELHRTTFVDRPKNLVYAWNYPQRKKVQFVYSHIRVHNEKAWTNKEVARLLGRSTKTLQRAVYDGAVKKPYKTYSLDGDPNYFGRQFWQSKDVYEVHSWLIEKERSRQDLPTRLELAAKMEEGVSYLIQDKDGKSVRVFKEQMW